MIELCRRSESRFDGARRSVDVVIERLLRADFVEKVGVLSASICRSSVVVFLLHAGCGMSFAILRRF